MEERHSQPLGGGPKLHVLEDREKPFWQARLGSECPRRVKRQDRGVYHDPGGLDERILIRKVAGSEDKEWWF